MFCDNALCKFSSVGAMEYYATISYCILANGPIGAMEEGIEVNMYSMLKYLNMSITRKLECVQGENPRYEEVDISIFVDKMTGVLDEQRLTP